MDNTVRTYLLHSGNLVKWCRGNFIPGDKNAPKSTTQNKEANLFTEFPIMFNKMTNSIALQTAHYP